MGRGALIWRVLTGILLVVSPAAWSEPASQPSTPAAQAPIVPPAKPGVFSLQKRGAARYHLAVAGHGVVSGGPRGNVIRRTGAGRNRISDVTVG